MIEIAKKIDIQPWMQDVSTRKVMDTLNNAGAEPQALFVGGCVRNTLLGLPFGEIDIAARHIPQETTKLLEDAGIKVIPTGIDHGTVTAVIGDDMFEITTLRRDVETDGRHATVAFTQDWREDAQRRDFTLNTLLADTDGNIYDPTGQGLADLDAGRIAFVGKADERIAEDYLRILRFFRFYALYGKGAPDDDALAACKAGVPGMAGLSRERITQEVMKIIKTERAVSIFRLMLGNDVLTGMPHKEADINLMDAVTNPVARLVVLADGHSEHMAVLDQYLVLSNSQKKDFDNIIKALDDIGEAQDKELKFLVYRYGAEIAGQAAALFAARDNKELNTDIIENWVPPSFPLSGEDVVAAGVPTGPDVGDYLRQVEAWWITQDYEPDRAACLEKLKALIEKS